MVYQVLKLKKCNFIKNSKICQSGLNLKKLFGDDFKLYTSQAPKKRTLTDISFAEIEEAIRIKKKYEENGIEDTNEEIRFYQWYEEVEQFLS